MKLLLFFICTCLSSSALFASTTCKVLKRDDYKRIIETLHKSDPIPRRSYKNAEWNEPHVNNNCYVRLIVSPDKNNYEYWETYWFDPTGELINAVPLNNRPVMTCNGLNKKPIEYFQKLLEEKRKKDLGLPRSPDNLKKAKISIDNCSVDLIERWQDDPSKPLLYRVWRFDQKGNIMEYTNAERNIRIFSEHEQGK